VRVLMRPGEHPPAPAAVHIMRAALPVVLTRLLLVAPERPVRRDVAMHQHHSLHLEYTAHRTIGASPARDYMDGADML
jgi:hypothetical protein